MCQSWPIFRDRLAIGIENEEGVKAHAIVSIIYSGVMDTQIELFQNGTDAGEQLGVTASMNKNLCGVGNTGFHAIAG